MSIARIILVGIILFISAEGNAQELKYNSFFYMISKNFRVSDSIKNNCNWQYAIVLLKTNLNGKITSAKVVNENAPDEMKRAFSFLNGYTFPANYKFKNKYVAFYYSISNYQVCVPKDTDIRTLPDEAISKVLAIYLEIKQRNPQVFIIPEIYSRAFVPAEINQMNALNLHSRHSFDIV